MELNEEFDALGVELGGSSQGASALTRRGIVVVGSHRSGTSALARVLNLVGCELPKHIMPPLEGSNDLGFWEPEPVVQAHEAFLAAIGSSWDDIAALPDGAFTSRAALELRQQLSLLLQDEYGTSLFVVKDPRISRLLPLWFVVLAELLVAPRTVIAVRNPLEVAASLKARDGFTTTKSLLLWLRHTLEAEKHSRGRPRAIVMYDELLRDWRGVLERVGDEIELTWPGISHRATVEIENFLSEQQRHHVYDWSDLEGRADVVSWVKDAYFALRASDPVPVLDEVHHQLSQADTAFGPILEEARMKLEDSQAMARDAASARETSVAEAEAREAALAARAAEVHHLQGEIERLTTARASLEEAAVARQGEVDALRAQRDGFAREVEVLAGELERLANAVEAAHSRATASEAEAATAREALGTARVEEERLRAVAENAVSRASTLEADSNAERGKLLISLEAARANIEQLEERIAATDSEFAALEAQAATERDELLEQLGRAKAQVDRLRADRDNVLSDLDGAKADASRLARQLERKSLDAEGLALVAEELLSAADVELIASEAERDRLHAELANALEEHGQLLILVERLEATLESVSSDRERAAIEASAASAAQQVAFDTAHSRLLTELEVARAEFGNARAQAELARTELDALKEEVANERAVFLAERDAASAERERLVAELERTRGHSERLSASIVELEAALDGQRAYLCALLSASRRRNLRRRSVAQLVTWLFPPTLRKLNYLRRYLFLRLSGEFEADSYLLDNPDVLLAGINPLMHYVEYGRGEGRQPFAGRSQLLAPTAAEPEPPVATNGEEAAADEGVAAQATPLDPELSPEQAVDIPVEEAPTAVEVGVVTSSEASVTLLTDELREALEAEFDPDYYLGHHPDVASAGMDPLEHYFYTGWFEARDPSHGFSTSYYLRSNPDVAAKGINPLVHYVLAGREEGRRPLPSGGFRRQTLEALRSLDEEIAHWQQGVDIATGSMDGDSLTAALATRIGTRNHVVVSCSHDNYTRIVGGVQLCVSLEQTAFVERGCAYVNLHPLKPLPILSRETKPDGLGLRVVCDGEEVGIASGDAVVSALTDLRAEYGIDFGLVVHALHGHSPEVIAEFHERLQPRWAWLWLHDYFGICPSATLLRNKIDPCGAPSPDSATCTICVFGEERLDHLPRFRRLLETVPFKLVAPSTFMASRWKQYFGDDHLEITVHEHGKLRQSLDSPQMPSAVPAEEAVRVAFLGVPTAHKGWGVFLELVRRHSDRGDYHFYHFGDGRYRAAGIELREVNVLDSGPFGMIDALRAESIDLAVVWSLAEESFSYTMHEALAAGAAVLTNKESGNVAEVASGSDDGIVFADELELFAAFDTGRITDYIRSRRSDPSRRASRFEHNHLTADLAGFDA